MSYRKITLKVPEKLIEKIKEKLEEGKNSLAMVAMQKWKMGRYVVLRIDDHGFEPEDIVFGIQIDDGLLIVFKQDFLKEE